MKGKKSKKDNRNKIIKLNINKFKKDNKSAKMSSKKSSKPQSCRLKFLGNGDAFSRKRGNTSAYLDLGSDLIVIDCGVDVCDKLIDRGLFDNRKRVHFFITHLHNDHAGSLAGAITYLYHCKFNKKSGHIFVYHPTKAVVDFLNLQGINPKAYSFSINRWDDIKLDGNDKEIEYIFEENEHSHRLDYNGESGTWSVELNMKNMYNIYYGGDSAGVKERITLTRIYDEIYHEVSSEKSEHHTSYEELKEAFSGFSKNEKSRIWLMHMDDDFDEEQAKADGFNVTKVESEDEISQPSSQD